MKALVYEAHGGPEVLHYKDVPDPVPGDGDVVIDVKATSINHLDVTQRNGWFALPGYSLPHIAGMDIAGTVREVGQGVTRFSIGDRVVVDPSLAGVGGNSKLAGKGDLYGALGVLGATVNGGYAERCLAPETHLYKIPDAMSFDVAAAFPTAWMTAHHALFDVGALKEGEFIMIHAAGSGVSMAAIQWAKSIGATVLATAGSEDKCTKARDLGADFTCVNRDKDVAAWAREVTQGRGVDMVFDHVGEALWAPSMFSLATRGRLVCCGNTSGDSPKIPSLGYMFHMGIKILGSDPYLPEEFGLAWDAFCDGDFQQIIDSKHALCDGAAAQEKLLSGQFFGKIILNP